MNKQALLPTGISVSRGRLFLGILLLAHAPSTAQGQQLFAGDRIRVRASQTTEPGHEWIEGNFVRLTPDSLWYETSGIVTPMSMDAVEIRRPTYRNHRWAGLAMGAATGGAVGALVAYASFEPRFGYEDLGLFVFCGLFFGACDPGPRVQLNSRGEETAAGAIGGALIGGGIGYFVGKALGGWETLELDQILIGNGNLTMSFRFLL